ncbi:ABC transporter permease [Helicobacter sp. 23-1044]
MYKVAFLLTPLVFCVIMAIFAQDSASDLAYSNLPPSFAHIFGTDLLGRDLFTKIANALRISLIVGFGASLLSIFFAIIFVIFARIIFYEFFMRVLDGLLALPSLLMVAFFQSLFGGGLFAMIVVIALGHFAFIAKVVDSAIANLIKSEFYLCAISLGASKFRAFCKDLLPLCVNLIAVLFIVNIAHSIAHEAVLSFFGFGVGLECESLGVLLSEGAVAIFSGAWWLVAYPSAFLLLLILPLLALSQNLQDDLGVKID